MPMALSLRKPLSWGFCHECALLPLRQLHVRGSPTHTLELTAQELQPCQPPALMGVRLRLVKSSVNDGYFRFQLSALVKQDR
jgi:hypothetical protein